LKTQWQRVLGVERLPDDHFAIYKSVTKFSYVEKQALMNELFIDKRKMGTMQRYCSISDFHKKVRGGKLIQVNPDRGIRGAVAWAKRKNKGIIPKRKLYEKYSIFSEQNYLTYAQTAAKKLKSPTIAAQIRDSRVMRLLKGQIEKELKK